jgi:hypothetical protein
VGRDLNAGGRGDRCGAQPAADATDTHQIGHHIVARTGAQGGQQIARPIEILAELDRRSELARQLGIARQIVVNDRLLEPVQVLAVERMATDERIAQRQALVEIHHQFDLFAGTLAHLPDRRHVVVQTIAAQAKF